MKNHVLIVAGLFLLLAGCGPEEPFRNITLVQNASTSVVSVVINTNDPEDLTLALWPVNGNDTLQRIVSGAEAGKDLKIALMPGTEYCYQLTYQGASGTLKSPVECFTMTPAPAHLPQFEVTHEPGFDFDGGILLKQYGSPAAHYIINSDGEITWFHLADSMPEKSFNLVNGNELLTLPSTKEILRLNFTADTLAQFNTNREMNREVHHDAFLLNGNTIAITYEYKVYDFTAFGGTAADSVKGDGVIVLDEEGQQVWHWSIFDNNAPPASKVLYQARIDYGHANAIAVAPDGNYLISFRDFNQVWKIDAKTGEVIWRLGDDGDYPLLPEQHFQKQHAIHYDNDGNLVIFDNMAEKRTISRILFFQLDEQGNEIKEFRQIKLPTDLYSFKQASAYQISDSTFLIASSMKNKVAIIDLSGKPLWQAQSSETFYRAYYVNEVDF